VTGLALSGDFHIVVLEQGLWLLRAPGADRAALQRRFASLQTAIGPADLEEALDRLFNEWPSLSWREAELRLWAHAGGSEAFDLEAPPLVDRG
jgi:hypothetical protein